VRHRSHIFDASLGLSAALRHGCGTGAALNLARARSGAAHGEFKAARPR
jgi:hypothetical protein